MLRTAKLFHPASTPTFRSTPGASLPGTLASHRIGLAPAGRRELVTRLRHDRSFAVMASELLGARVLGTHGLWINPERHYPAYRDTLDCRVLRGSMFQSHMT
jgi:hypothetical protein